MKDKIIKILFKILLISIPVLCFAESCDNIGQIEYKADDKCGFEERKCCQNKLWSDWDGDCDKCECSPGSVSYSTCLAYVGPNYKGNVKLKCGSDCKWELDDTSECVTPIFIKIEYTVTGIPKFYYFTGGGGCETVKEYVKIYNEQTGNYAAEFRTNRPSNEGYSQTQTIISDIIELDSDTDYYTIAGDYDCFSHGGYNDGVNYYNMRCPSVSLSYGSVEPGMPGSSPDNPLIDSFDCTLER